MACEAGTSGVVMNRALAVLFAGLSVLVLPCADADLDAYLAAPENLVYEAQEDGTWLSWEAPASGQPVERYLVYVSLHMAGPTPYEVLSTIVVDGGSTAYFDADATGDAVVLYHVTAVYEGGVESRMSNPAFRSNYPNCSVLRPDIDPVTPGLHTECLFPLPPN